MDNIRQITLSDKEIVDGEVVRTNEETYNLLLNNRALKYGIDKGLLKTTIINDVFKDIESDIQVAWNVLYLGFIGANKDIDKKITFAKFIEKIDIPFNHVMYKAQTLFFPELPENFDDYVESLERLTDKPEKK